MMALKQTSGELNREKKKSWAFYKESNNASQDSYVLTPTLKVTIF